MQYCEGRLRWLMSTASMTLAAVLCSGCATATISVGQLDPIAMKGIKRLAVLDFRGGDTQGALSGPAVAGIVQTRLSMMPGFEVIEREKLQDIIRELKLTEEGIINEDTAQEFRKGYGVDGIITGSIIQYSQEQRFDWIPFIGLIPYNQTSVSFNLRVIDTSDAKAIYICSGENSQKNKTYLEVAGRIVDLALEPLKKPESFRTGQTIKK